MVHQICNSCIKLSSCLSETIKARVSGSNIYLYFVTKRSRRDTTFRGILVQASFDILTLYTYPVLLCFLHILLNPLDSFLGCRPLLLLLHSTSSSNLESQRWNIFGDPGLFFRRSFTSISLAASAITVFVSGNQVFRPFSDYWKGHHHQVMFPYSFILHF